MPQKNAIVQAWHNSIGGDITPDPVNGRRYSQYRDGQRPGTAPVLFYTDIIDGPTSGGENNKGCYMSLFGKNFPPFSAWGVSAFVKIGGVNVDNYRFLTNAVDSGSTGNGPGWGVYQDFGLQHLSVQVGALGNPTPGVALKIEIFVNGTPLANLSNGTYYLDFINAIPLTFTPTQGTCKFVDPVNGLDSNTGDWGSPWLHLSSANGLAGAMRKATGSNRTDGTPAGQHTYLMPGPHAQVGSSVDDSGNYGSWAFLFRISGTQPAAGLNKGNLVIKSYPPVTGAVAPTVASWTPSNGNHAGAGIYGNENARGSNGSEVSINPYDGQLGWGRDVVVSNVKIVCSGDAPRDGAPINLGADAHRWRVVNNEFSWPSTLGTPNGDNGAKAGCVAGNGLNPYIVGNYMHDVSNGDGANQNHFVYFDGSNVCCNGGIVCWNSMRHNTGGNGIQTFNSQASDFIVNILDHNNVIVDVNKHAINISDNTRSRKSWNNLCIGAGESLIYFSSGAVNAANAQSVENCTLVDWGKVVGGRGAIKNDGGTGTGSTNVRNCIFMRRATGGGTGPFTTLDGVGTNNLLNNRFYDASGNAGTSPPAGTGNTYGDPGFKNVSLLDFSLASGSTCIGAAGTNLITRGFDLLGNTLDASPDQGAFEYGAHL